MARLPQRCRRRATQRKSQAHRLQPARTQVMRGFGRPCRGPGHVFVTLVRHTAPPLLELGTPITALGPPAPPLLGQATALSDSTRARLAEAFHAALSSPPPLRTPSPQLTHGKKLRHGPRVPADELTRAPLLKGTSPCPAPGGRTPGSASEPATGLLWATRGPAGKPNDASAGLPWLDQVHSAIARVQRTPTPRLHAGAGDLGVQDAARRQALHERGRLTVGIPKSVKPLDPHPRAEEVHDSRNAAGFHRKRTPSQVQWACACGSRRPVVESHIASLRGRGAGQGRSNGHPGAVRQQGMAVMAQHRATLGRIQQQHRSKRAQKFRRLLGLRHRKINEIHNPKN